MKELRIILAIVGISLSILVLGIICNTFQTTNFNITDLGIVTCFILLLTSGIIILFFKLDKFSIVISCLIIIATFIFWTQLWGWGAILLPFAIYAILNLWFCITSFFKAK